MAAARLIGARSPATSPPRTACFDIFSPLPGDSDVISQLDRRGSTETRTAPGSVRTALSFGLWGPEIACKHVRCQPLGGRPRAFGMRNPARDQHMLHQPGIAGL